MILSKRGKVEVAHGERGAHAVVGANISLHSHGEVTASALVRVEPLFVVMQCSGGAAESASSLL